MQFSIGPPGSDTSTDSWPVIELAPYVNDPVTLSLMPLNVKSQLSVSVQVEVSVLVVHPEPPSLVPDMGMPGGVPVNISFAFTVTVSSGTAGQLVPEARV
jgi:hypothetical protein